MCLADADWEHTQLSFGYRLGVRRMESAPTAYLVRGEQALVAACALVNGELDVCPRGHSTGVLAFLDRGASQLCTATQKEGNWAPVAPSVPVMCGGP